MYKTDLTLSRNLFHDKTVLVFIKQRYSFACLPTPTVVAG